MAKYQQYAEYKDSGVDWLGEIPTTWSIFRGKYVFTEFNERSETGEETLLSVSEYYGVKPRAEKISEGDFLSRAESLEGYKKCYPNDLVMNIMLAWKKGLGVTKYEGIVSPAYSVFRFKSHIDADYMHYLLRTNQYIDHFKTRSTGVIDSRLRLYPDSFADVSILTPPKNEQNQIAKFLDYETGKIDSLIEKQQQLIQLLKEKRQAVISHAVTKGLNSNVRMKDSGVEWLGQVPEHWIVSKLKYESEVVDCRNKTPEYFENGEYFVIRTTNVKNQKLNFNGALYTDKKNFEIWTQRGVPPAGSILFTREAPTGEVCLVPENIKFCMGQRMMNFIANTKSYSDYLFDYLISDCLERYINSVSHGSTVTHLRVEQVENIPVLVPSDAEIKEIHHHILIIKNKYDAIENKAHQTIQLMQERRTALISAAVTGKIDVQNWQNPTEAKMEFSA